MKKEPKTCLMCGYELNTEIRRTNNQTTYCSKHYGYGNAFNTIIGNLRKSFQYPRYWIMDDWHIINFTEEQQSFIQNSLNNGISYRQITKLVNEKFNLKLKHNTIHRRFNKIEKGFDD